jgi:hypothetical protein
MPHCGLEYIILVMFNHNTEVIKPGVSKITRCNKLYFFKNTQI